MTELSFGPVAMRLGMLATIMRRWEDAERHFSTAIDCCSRLGAPALTAHVMIEQAVMLLARKDHGDREHALDLLRRSEGICAELGMTGVLKRARRLMTQVPASQQSRDRG